MDKLNDRLQLLADEIEIGETMADIGTDHGFLPLYLWKQGISPHVIMCDISEPSLAKAKGAAGSYQFGQELDFRAGDGLKVLQNGEVDAVVIAGMGGLLITKILAQELKKTKSFKKFVLQPRNHSGHLRFWLVSNGFKITKNKLVREGKFICEIITANPINDPETARFSSLEAYCEAEPAIKDEVNQDDAYWELPDELSKLQPQLTSELATVKLNIDKKILVGLKRGNSLDKKQVDKILQRIDYWKKLI